MPAKKPARTKRKALRPARGYQLKPLGRGRVALMRRGGRGLSATFSCSCSGTSGSCQVRILSGGIAVCESTTCTGSCDWVVSLAGISGAWMARA